MLPPQSDEEIRPIVQALQRLDASMDLRWNPRAVIEARGSYDVTGKIIDPVYGGRWEVVRYDSPTKTAEWRAWEKICTVTTPVTISGVMGMMADGPYMPVGDWLVSFFESNDRANREDARRLSAALDALNERREAAMLASHEAAEREALGRMFIEGTMEGGVSQFHPVRIDLTGATQ